MTMPEQFERVFGTEARIKWFGTDGPPVYPLLEEIDKDHHEVYNVQQYLAYERRILESA